MGSLGVYIGRFSPLHNGHLEVIKYGEKNFDRLLIFVGSYSTINTKTPYEGELRDKMVCRVIDKLSTDVIVISDAPTNELWATVIRMNVGQTEDVWLLSGQHEWYFDLFPEYGTCYISSPYSGLNATLIRNMLKHGLDVSNLVPFSTLELLHDYT